jgi:hypothetical protein
MTELQMAQRLNFKNVSFVIRHLGFNVQRGIY